MDLDQHNLAHENGGSEVRNMSHGRGGAGNITKTTRRDSSSNPHDLVTPTIKSQLYTTGRGGTGNMVRNDPDHPELARAAQDLEPHPGAGREPDGPKHFGRGGAANVTTTTAAAPHKAGVGHWSRDDESDKPREGTPGHEDGKGLGNMAKDLLGKMKK